MLSFSRGFWFCGVLLLAGAAGFSQTPVVTETNVTVRVMAANLTSGTSQSYEAAGLRIFQGLKPDIVAIQEFKYGGSTAPEIRSFVDTAFGPSFTYFRETTGLPNGIISRWPIVASGIWDDGPLGVSDREFPWVRIDLPGTNDLYVVSVHLKASSGTDNEGRRFSQATNLINQIKASFPPNAWVIVGGDCNIDRSTENAFVYLTTNLVDAPIPADQLGGTNTNLGRSERYDYVFANLAPRLVPTVYGANSHAKGLVLDSRNYSPIAALSPVQSGDSGVSGMQHMGVVRSYSIPYLVTNYVVPLPVIASHPTNTSAPQGTSASFSVAATGSGLSYQWRFGTTNLPSAIGATFTRSSVQPPDAGAYSVVVSNAAGAVTSNPAMLELIIPPATVSAGADGVLHWTGLSNATYRVQRATNLAAPAWLDAGTARSADGRLSFTNTSLLNPCFYRVVYP
jgi:endonuclease/exonuclease/phosphatase family metal-dependent hydrolase